MNSKIKSIFKRQISQPNHSLDINSNKDYKLSLTTVRRQKSLEALPTAEKEDVVVFHKNRIIRRQNVRSLMSVGALEDILQCSICNGRLNKPKMLPCQHTFCQKCLGNGGNFSTKKDVIIIICPICHLTVNDKKSTQDLPTNLYIESLLKIVESHDDKTEITERTPIVTFAPLPKVSEVNAEVESRTSATYNCCKCKTSSVRDNKCRHCKEVFCAVCWPLHITELRNQLGIIAMQLEKTSNKFENKIHDFRTKVEEIKNTIDKDIEARITELRLEREEKFKLAENMKLKNERKAEEIQEKIEKHRRDIGNQKEEIYENLSDNHEKVKMFLSVHRRATELMATVSTWEPELNLVNEPSDASKERVDGNSVTKTTEHSDGTYRKKKFVQKIVLDRERVQRPSRIAYDNTREHIYVTSPGRRQIVVLDKKYQVLRSFHHQEMMAPQGIAFLKSTEEILVTDKWRHCIFVFNRKGELRRTVGSKGEENGQLKSPEGIALHPQEELIYVADTGNNRIQIFNIDGSFHSTMGSERTTSGVTKCANKNSNSTGYQFSQPTDVVLSQTHVIIADCGNHKVKVYRHDGKLEYVIGGSRAVKGFFRSPEVLAIDCAGNIFIGDSGNGTIQIFSEDGQLLRVIGGNKSNDEQFGWISGICVKSNFDLLVADSKRNTVLLF